MIRIEPSYVLILDGWRPVNVLGENDSCHPYYDNDRCGGCGECMLMQQAYWSSKSPESAFRCRHLTGFWKFYEWAWYNTVTRVENLWYRMRHKKSMF